MYEITIKDKATNKVFFTCEYDENNEYDFDFIYEVIANRVGELTEAEEEDLLDGVCDSYYFAGLRDYDYEYTFVFKNVELEIVQHFE